MADRRAMSRWIALLAGTQSAGARLAVALLAVLSALMLQGCGFQLQGRQALPASLSTLAIETTEAQSEFTQALRAVLVTSGGKLIAQGAAVPAGTTTVIITHDSVTERVLSVSSRNIPTDYELTYTVDLAVRGKGADGKGSDLMPRETFTLSRVYSFDETKLLAKEREKDILVQALARDMASVVARRLSAL
jgi:LPS-assembly lipoprotein